MRQYLLGIALAIATIVCFPSALPAQIIIGPGSLPTPSGSASPSDIIVGVHGNQVVQFSIASLAGGLTNVPLSALAPPATVAQGVFPGSVPYTFPDGAIISSGQLSLEGMMLGATVHGSFIVPASSTQPFCVLNAAEINSNLCVSDTGAVTALQSIQAPTFAISLSGSSYPLVYDSGTIGTNISHIERGSLSVPSGGSTLKAIFTNIYNSAPLCTISAIGTFLSSRIASIDIATIQMANNGTSAQTVDYICVGN